MTDGMNATAGFTPDQAFIAAADTSIPTLAQRLRNLADWLENEPHCTVAYLPREAADKLEQYYVLHGRLVAAVEQDRAALAKARGGQ